MMFRRLPVARCATALSIAALAGCVAVAPTVRPDADPGGTSSMSVRAAGGSAPVGRPSAAPADAASPADPATSAAPSPAASEPAAVDGSAPPLAASSAPLVALASPSADAGAAPSAAPSAAPLVFSSPIATIPGAAVVANPFGLPTRISLDLPKGLGALLAARLVSNNGGNLITDNGAGVVSNGGAGLISDHGSGLISDAGAGILGKMKYRVATAPRRLLATPGESAAKLLGDTVSNLSRAQAVLDAMLKGAAAAGLQAGQSVALDFGGQPHVMALRVSADHATLTIDRGAAPDPAKRIAAIAFTSPARGAVTYLDPGVVAGGPRLVVHEDFDLEAGTITAAAAAFVPGLAPGTGTYQTSRYDLRRPAEAPAGRAFVLRTSTVLHSPLDLMSPTGWKIAADFAPDGAGAYWGEIFNKLGGPFLLPVDGISFGGAPPAPYAFFIGTDGLDLAEASAPTALRAILPALDVAVPAYPASPKDADPFLDPVFAFPE